MKIGGFFIALLLLLTAACSSDPAPREPDPAPSPTSTATPPAMPAQAREDSSEGAAAFVKYWVDVSNYAAATGDVTELSRISTPDCSGCQKYIDLYRDTYAAGGYFKGGEWKLGDLTIQPDQDSTIVFGSVTSDRGSFKLTEADDPATGTAEDSDLTFITTNHGGGWRLATLEQQAPS